MSRRTNPASRSGGLLLSIVAGIGLLVALLALPMSSASFSATTSNPGNSMTSDQLDPPTSLVATGGGQVTLDWTATVDTYADGHRIYRSNTPGGPYVQIAQITPRATETYVDNAPDGTYHYVVRSFAAGWESANSNEISGVVSNADDYDAIPAGSDNCPTTFNVDQFDTDGDGIGDACDPSPTVASSGVFTSSGQTFSNVNSSDVAAGDFDDDGDLDLVYANNSGPNTILTNDGSGTFTDTGQALGTANTTAVEIGDLDGDGDLDIAFGISGANTVWLNDGFGMFVSNGQSLGIAQTSDIALGDFDGDGDLDIASANKASDTIWLNNGLGAFTDSGQSLVFDESRGITVGALDGDADLDLAFSGKAVGSVWSNNGAGVFTNTGQSLDDGDDLASADIDGDGDLDIAYAVRGGTGNTIYTNNGAGVYTFTGQDFAGDAYGVVFGDFDGDGDRDLTYALNAGSNTLYLNNGAGTFANSGQALEPLKTFGVVAADLDGDGDLDLANANQGANTIWFNDAGPAVALTNMWQTGTMHVPGAGTDRMLVFVATNEQQSLTAPTLTGVTYGGQPLAFVMADGVGNGCCHARSEIWVLDEAGLAAASGTSLVPIWSTTPNIPLYSHIVYSNVEQTDPFGAQTSATVIGDTPNPVPMSSVVTSTGDMVLAVAVAGEAGTYTAQNGFTLGITQSTTTGGTTASGTAQKTATGANETVSMLFNPAAPPWTNRQVALALVLHAAP